MPGGPIIPIALIRPILYRSPELVLCRASVSVPATSPVGNTCETELKSPSFYAFAEACASGAADRLPNP